MLPTVQWHLRENGALKNDNLFFKVCVAVFEQEKKKHLSVFCFLYLSKRADFKDKVKKKKIINEGKWSDNFSFLTSDKLPQINLSHFFKATHIRILSLPMCDSRNCLEKGNPSEIKYLAVFQPQTRVRRRSLWQKQNAKWKLLFSWISNNLWIT